MLGRITSCARVSTASLSFRSYASLTGTVKWFDERKGFGFLKPDGESSKDVFVHFSAIRAEGQFKTLKDGERVTFKTEETSRGPQAIEVSPVDSE
eukprot:c2620_g1_i1.p1 GENE.c2620_g1_i1~~c2620_g1_i1.p1  ORF type:complete len:105 (-),score=26.89 c2620_g1_i1:118-402(-)